MKKYLYYTGATISYWKNEYVLSTVAYVHAVRVTRTGNTEYAFCILMRGWVEKAVIGSKHENIFVSVLKMSKHIPGL